MKIERLKELRLLPPPANELVPMLLTNLAFILATLALKDMPEMWAKKVEVHDASGLFVYGIFAIYMTMYWGYSVLLHLLEHSVPSLKQFKIQPKETTTWKDISKMVPLVLFNQVVLGLPLLHIFFGLLSLRIEDAQALVTEVPSVPRFFLLIVIHVICVEFWFYGVHRLLHSNRFLYAKIHSLHHSYKAPSGLEAAYVHPIEFCMNSFPVLWIGPLLTKSPLIVTWMWIWMVTFLQVHDHSGFWVPFLPRVLMHDYHHQKPQCCYGIVGLLDGVFGTDGGWNNYVAEQEKGCLSKRAIDDSKTK